MERRNKSLYIKEDTIKLLNKVKKETGLNQGYIVDEAVKWYIKEKGILNENNI